MMSFSRSLPLGEWPELDRELWRRACSTGADFLDEQGIAARWRPATRHIVQDQYGHALSWLSRHGALDPACSPVDRWTAGRLSHYVTEMRGQLAATTIQMRILAIEQMIRVMQPDADRSLLKRVKRSIRAQSDWRRKLDRLQTPETLVQLGFSLMDDAEASDRKRHLRATGYRDGLMIALLAHLPMRRRNMCAIEIGRHLVRRGQAWWITIPGTETKNHRPLEVEVPRFLVSRLERYLGHWRPILCAGRYAGDRLWVLFHGKPLPYKAFGERIETRTERALGVKVPPHAFRDAAATAIATGDPGNYGHAASVLGHARLATTMRYYTIAGTKEAVAGHADTLERLRREASRKNRRTPE